MNIFFICIDFCFQKTKIRKETTKSLLHLQCENYMSYVIHHHSMMPEKKGMKCSLYSVSEMIMPHSYAVMHSFMKEQDFFYISSSISSCCQGCLFPNTNLQISLKNSQRVIKEINIKTKPLFSESN